MQLSVNGRAEAMPLEFVPAGGGALDWQHITWFADMQASENRLRIAALPDSPDGARGLNVDELTIAPRVQTACTEAALVLDGSSGTIDCVLSEAATAAAVPAACRWLIQPRESGQIRITFHQLALEAQFDQLRIFDGAAEGSQSLLWASGRRPVAPVVTSSSQALIVLVRDGTVDEAAVVISYLLLPPTARATGSPAALAVTSPIVARPLCSGEVTLTAVRGAISGGGSGVYSNSTLCVWRIRPRWAVASGPGAQLISASGVITITFTLLDLIPLQDSLQVFDGPTEQATKVFDASQPRAIGASRATIGSIVALSGSATIRYSSSLVGARKAQGFDGRSVRTGRQRLGAASWQQAGPGRVCRRLLRATCHRRSSVHAHAATKHQSPVDFACLHSYIFDEAATSDAGRRFSQAAAAEAAAAATEATPAHSNTPLAPPLIGGGCALLAIVAVLMMVRWRRRHARVVAEVRCAVEACLDAPAHCVRAEPKLELSADAGEYARQILAALRAAATGGCWAGIVRGGDAVLLCVQPTRLKSAARR